MIWFEKVVPLIWGSFLHPGSTAYQDHSKHAWCLTSIPKIRLIERLVLIFPTMACWSYIRSWRKWMARILGHDDMVSKKKMINWSNQPSLHLLSNLDCIIIVIVEIAIHLYRKENARIESEISLICTVKLRIIEWFVELGISRLGKNVVEVYEMHRINLNLFSMIRKWLLVVMKNCCWAFVPSTVRRV